MEKRTFNSLSVCCLLLGFPVLAGAQPAELLDRDTISVLTNALHEKKADRERIHRILSAMNRVDSVYEIHSPTWMVLDEDLKERIYRAFLSRFGSVPRDPRVKVVANEKKDQIVSIAIGTNVMGRLDAHTNLSSGLYSDILAANYPLQIVDPIPEPQRVFEEETPPKFLGVKASVFGASLLFSNGWGLEMKTGYEEIGYHFWSTGSFRILAVIGNLKIGGIFPFVFGNQTPEVTEALTLRPRRMSGAKGISLNYTHPFRFGDISASVNVGELNYLGSPGTALDMNKNYFLHTVAQLLFSDYETLGEGNHRFKLTGGIGHHQVNLGITEPDGKIFTVQKLDFVSPVLRVDYTHVGERMYGMGAQFYSSILFLSVWTEIVKNFLFLDFKYYAPVFRSPKPWENDYFYMISPRFQLIF